MKESIENIKRHAETGDAKSVFYLGFCYEFGIGVSEDIQEAIRLYLEAYVKGEDVIPILTRLLASEFDVIDRLIRLSDNPCKFKKLAYVLFEKGRSSGSVNEAGSLAFRYILLAGIIGLSGAREYIANHEIVGVHIGTDTSNLSNNDKFLLKVIHCYTQGVIFEKNDVEAHRYANQVENKKALCDAGYINEENQNEQILEYQNYSLKNEEIQYLLEEAVESSDAKRRLAEIYFEGIGVEKNVGKAIEWYRRAAKQGDKLAIKKMSDLYFERIAVAKNIDESLAYLIQISEPGTIYYKGLDYLRKDESNGIEFIKCAAEHGYALAQLKMGTLSIEKSDYENAFYWLAMAFKSGEKSVAAYCLSSMYLNGNAVAKDAEKAQRWLILSAENGNKEAQLLLEKYKEIQF